MRVFNKNDVFLFPFFFFALLRNRSKISWMKDHILLVRSEKHDVNKKGTLRIREVTFSDSGVYSCIGILYRRNSDVTLASF